MNRAPETELDWLYLNGLEERELVEEIKHWRIAALRAQARLDDKREAHVQEVIARANHVRGYSTVGPDYETALRSLLDSASKLAEWRP